MLDQPKQQQQQKSKFTTTMKELKETINSTFAKLNQKLRAQGKKPMDENNKNYVLLQEVTKASIREICGDLAVVHTHRRISKFSVTGFYKVGLELGTVQESQIIPYNIDDILIEN